jgi:hypothetical protein
MSILFDGHHLKNMLHEENTIKPGYNNTGLYKTSPIASDILWYKLIPDC